MKRVFLSQSLQCYRPFQWSLLPQFRSANFHVSSPRWVIKPILLADVGEGITECQIVQWFVQPGARVAQFDKICEVQSDKAAAEISSRYDGIITKIHCEAEEVAKVGQPLAEIDVEDELQEKEMNPHDDEIGGEAVEPPSPRIIPDTPLANPIYALPAPNHEGKILLWSPPLVKRHLLATPAVRAISRQANVDLSEIQGTGREGRIMKEDVQSFIAEQTVAQTSNSQEQSAVQDKCIPITGVRGQMFKNMTKSLSIPHFLYTSYVDFTSLTDLRKGLQQANLRKISPLPFVIKAVSLAFNEYPQLICHLDASNAERLVLVQKSIHNFGIAIDSPHGLVVPVIRNVNELTILEISTKVNDLAERAQTNSLRSSDFTGASFTISNIGSIGGGAVAPVIPTPQVAILGIGRSRPIALWDDLKDCPRRVEECVFSWSADHRVVDGATVAKAGEKVRMFLEQAGTMMSAMK